MNKTNYGKIFPYQNLQPKLESDVFIAHGSVIIGDVQIDKSSSVWYNCVIRGDVNYIKIGSMTNIQDLSMLHVTNKLHPMNIGNRVTIGHSVKLHGCTIEDLSLIGIGAVVLDGAIIKNNSIVAAGAVVRPGFIVPEKVLVAGVPAKIVRELTQVEIDDLFASSERYIEYTRLALESLRAIADE